jgi:hypothetical protein
MLTKFTSNELFSFITNAAAINDVAAAYTINKKSDVSILASGWNVPEDTGVKFISSDAELKFKNLNLDSTIMAEIKFTSADFISENRLFDFEIYLNKIKIPHFYPFGKNTLRFSIPESFVNSKELTITLFDKSFVPQKTIIQLSAINFYSQIYDEQLVNKLINNAIFASIHEGNLKATLENGNQVMIHSFVSAGAITEYYKNWKDWKSDAILFATSDKQLIEKLKKRMNE